MTANQGKVTKLRAKRLPQDDTWLPPTGIRIVEPNVPYDPIGSAQFRIEELFLPKIVENLQRYFRRMPTHVRVRVDDSWSRLREKLEGLPRMQENLPKMRLHNLPKQVVQPDPHLPDEYSFVVESEELPEIVGDVFEEGLFDSNICMDQDVLVYTECQEGRPWIGRVKEILEDRNFKIQWYQRQGKSSRFLAMFNPDKTPYLSRLETSNVMMWDMTVQKTKDSFYVTPYRLTQINKEYVKYDNMFAAGPSGS